MPKLLFALVATIVGQSAFATDSMTLKLSLKTVDVYSALSETKYVGKTSSGTMQMSVKGLIGGQTVDENQSQDLGTTAFDGASLETLSEGRIKLTGTDGQSLTVPVTILSPTSFVVDSGDMKKAILILVKDKLDAAKAQLARAGIKGKIQISSDQMLCEQTNATVTCSAGFSLQAEVEK